MLKAILKTGFIAGTLDGLAAVIILAKLNAVGVFQYVASGVFGKESFSGGTLMTVAGIFLHYFIAFSFTTFYFFLFPYVPFLRKQKLIGAIGYGLFVWSVMNLAVVPLSHVTMAPFNWSRALINMAILIVCIGLPISLLTNKYYDSKNS